jgi:hypothetical protein
MEGRGAQRLIEAIARIDLLATLGRTGAWGDESRLVVVIDFGSEVALPDLGPWDGLADEVVIGEPRVDGERSVELFVSR